MYLNTEKLENMKEQLTELLEMLKTDSNCDWSVCNPNDEFKTLSETVRGMIDGYNPREEYKKTGYFGLHWSTEDIIGKAKEHGHTCTEEQAQEIAEGLESKGDCNYGITWEHIDMEIADYFGN